MANDLSNIEHLRKLASSSRKYTDSLVLELADAFMKTIGGIQNQFGSSCTCDGIEEKGEYAMGDNILDNCDFKINQRMVTGTIGDPGYFVDRWSLVDGDVTIEDDGIRLNGTITQKLEKPIDGPTVASVFFDNGIMAASYDNSSQTFTIKANGQLLKMAKLEVGNRQTLARQEGDRWILNDPPPNFQQELAKCQRHQLEINLYKNPNIRMGVGIANTTNTAGIIIPIPVTLRAFPKFKISGRWAIHGEGIDITEITNSVTSIQISSNNITVVVTSTKNNLVKANPYSVSGYGDSNARCLLDANL